MQAAVNASSAGTDGYISPTSSHGDAVYIPAGSCSWSSSVSWTNKNIGVVGGVGGTTTISPSGDMFDVSVTGAAGNGQSTAAAFRISGLTMTGGHLLNINVSNPNMTTWAGYYRVDNIHYTTSAGGNAVIIYGPVYGVFDHLTGSVGAGNHFEQAMFLNSEYPPSSSLLMGETVGRTYAIGLGDQNAVYIEDSSFACTGTYGAGALSDSESGPQRMVLRHSSITGTCYNYAHWTRNGEWDGGRIEIYNNVYNCNGSNCSGGYPGRFDAGTGVIFNNQIIGYGTTSFQIDEARGCGAQTGGVAGSCAGSPPTNSQIDVNAGDASAPGWPCAGQVGSACIGGSCARGAMNSVPFIMWNNGAQAGCATGGSCTNSITFNVDGPPGGGSCTRTTTNYIKSTAHSLAGGYNGAIDYFSGASKPSIVGIYTGIASYSPFTYPYPTTTGGTPTYTLSTGFTGSGSGTITCTPSGSGILSGMAYSCSIAASAGSTLSSVTGCGGSGTTTYTGTMPASNCTVIATFVATASTPGFSPAAGSYGATQTVTISSATPSATICYTVDGTTPTANGSGTCTHGSTYSAPISVSTSQTVKAVASKSGFNDSTVGSAAYTINGAASNPTFSPVAGSYATTQSVTISSSTAGATLCYTTDGSTPTANGAGVCTHGITYSGAVSVSTSLTLKALASKSTFLDSAAVSAAYVINGAVADPTFSPVAGTYSSAQTVTLASSTSGATICFTVDGSTPTASAGTCTHGTTYSTPFSVSTTQTVTAIASKSTYSNSAVTSALYTINGTLPTPTFAPAAGSYGAAQTVTISAYSGSSVVIVNSMRETANASDTLGHAPHRNAYTNCIETCSGNVPAPSPAGTLWCTSSAKSTYAGACPSYATHAVVAATLTGTGLGSLENGNGAGGSDSLTTVTATYAGSGGTGQCDVGTNNNPSGYVPGLTMPGDQSNSQLINTAITGSPGNSSDLVVTKYNSSADAGRYIVRQDCVLATNGTTVGGAHYEYDDNYNTTGGTYMGFGKDYDFPNKKFRAGPQSSPWINEELCPVAGGACVTTYNWPAGDYLYSESYQHWDAGCTFSSGTACAHYDAVCLQLWTGGSPVNSLTCYNIRNASTHAAIAFIPINKTSWTHPQYAIQHQWDVNQSSKTLTATIPFSNAVAYYTTSGFATICYTTDGSTPTGNGAGTCTHGTTYTSGITVSTTTTVKAIATQSGFLDSAVGSATYTINGTAATPTFSPVAGTYTSAQSVTIASTTSGATLCYTIDGTTPTADGAGNCTHGTTYSGAVSVGSTLTLKAIASKASFSDSAVQSGLFTINIPVTVHVTITGTQKFSGNVTNP